MPRRKDFVAVLVASSAIAAFMPARQLLAP
jgi:hypothetical protein